MTSVCRACLAGNTHLRTVKNQMLHSLYEKLTNSEFNSDDARPRALCCSCYQKLLRCQVFSQMAVRSEKIFNHLYEMRIEVTQDYITEVNLNMEQHLSVAAIPIDVNVTDEGTQGTINDAIDIKEEVISEPDQLPSSNNRSTLKEDISGWENDTETLLSETHIGQFTLSSIDIKEEITTELDKVEIESLPEKRPKSLIIFEEDHSDPEEDVVDLIHVEKTKPDDSKMSFSCKNCNKIFDIKSKLISHIRNFHSKQKKEQEYLSTKKHIEDKTIRNEKERLPCSLCDKIFKTKSRKLKRDSNLIYPMRTDTDIAGKKPIACNVCEKQFYHKSHLYEHTRTHTENGEAQVVLGPSEQATKTQSSKMLIYLQNGEQRLVTFTLKKSCHLKEILEQLHVPFSKDTPIQCMQSHRSGIDFFVTIGLTTRIEDMISNHPMLAGEMRGGSSPGFEDVFCDQENDLETIIYKNLIINKSHHKGHVVKHVRTHRENTEAQAQGPSEQETGLQTAKMLIFLQNGEQRLITFTIQKSCTLKEILEQLHVPFSEDTRIQCMRSRSSGIDYFVSLGSTTNLEDTLQNHPMFLDKTGNRSSSSEMERPRNREESTSEKSTSCPVKDPESPRRSSPPPRHVDGMLALCRPCGYTGFDFNRCERCKRVFHEEPKWIPIARKRLNRRRRNQKK